MSAFVMLAMALLPGMPILPFFILGLLTALFARNTFKRQTQEQIVVENQKIAEQKAEVSKQEETVAQSLKMDELRIELGLGLQQMAIDQKFCNLYRVQRCAFA